jgi:osmotically inducible protein OsmC
MPTISRGSTVWQGDLAKGSGKVTASSGLFRDADVTWAKRAEDRSSGTSPEELLAAAHSACFSMALAARLGKNGTPATRLDVTAAVTFDTAGGAKITASDLEVRAQVPGIDEATFQKLVDDAKENCPVSVAIRGNVRLSVKGTLG